MKLLHIDASARGEGSVSRDLSAAFVRTLSGVLPDVEVERLDLAVATPRHVSQEQTAAMYVPEAERSPAQRDALRESEQLCSMLLDADALVCAMPMYNFGMPSVFKAFVDNVVRIGRTFEQNADGIVGHLGGRRCAFITTRGADYAPDGPMAGMDCLTPHLRTVFGFLGVRDMSFVNVEPTQFGDERQRERAISAARTRLDDVARAWAA